MDVALTAARPRTDLRTLSVAVAIHGGFLLWSASFTLLPLWLAAPLGSLLLAWYGSLQHETIHGHPTASARINSCIGGLPLSLWIPYAIYRETHIRHHRHGGRRLTEVGVDPESFYLPPGYLASVGPFRRVLLMANCTLLGRIVLGPAITLVRFSTDEARKVAMHRGHWRVWARHLLGVALVLTWLVGVCDIPVLTYAVLVVYPSMSITNLRSFAEHRADDHSHLRTNVVEAGPGASLLFLNNNLHVAHHMRPDVPWHALPAVWRQMRGRQASGAGLVFSGGYLEVARKYLLRPFITAEHPGTK